MNAPRDLGPDFRSWLRDVPPMPADLPGRTLEETRHTRQRRRWLWFLPGPQPTAGAEERNDRATPTPANDGYANPLAGRTTTMLSATKIVAGAAVLALTSGLLLAGALTTGPADPVPGAELDRTDYIIVTGTSTMSGGGAPSGDDTMSDPRVSGHANVVNKYLVGDEDLTGVNWGQYTLANDGGSWVGEWVGFYESIRDDDEYGTPGRQNTMVWAEGTGDYEGWSYVANYTGHLLGLDVKGLLYQGPIPPTVALGMLEASAE